MGITGCGKTSFVNHFADQKLRVGHTLDSCMLCTQSVEIAACTIDDGTKIYLVDTPGFDDTTRSDTEILREVAAWLINAYNAKFKLAGIVYLHRIQDTRIGGTGAKNLKMFRRLCGDSNLGSVVLATTMWDLTDQTRAREREAELKREDTLWAPMIREGSTVLRQDNGKTSAQKIINHLMERKTRITLDIQRELVEKKLRLEETGAGSELVTVMEKLLQRYEAKIREVERKLQEEVSKKDADVREMLEEAKKEFEDKLDKAKADTQNLQVTHEEILAAERLRYEQAMRDQEAKHKEDLIEQKRKVQDDIRKKVHECIVM
ncbi:hypothetical protein SLS59_005878 [Nothophoma quercina]|uniref:G domain-containing protein n=1 Tax=Nothophoma quercina TaxID=749835 RepID=A0ABR3R7Y9_9PLEO